MSQAARNQRTPTPAPRKEKQSRDPRMPLRSRLRAWREQHLFGFFSSLGRLAARPWATMVTVLVLGFALALPLLLWLAFDNARELSGDLREAREVTVFLKPALSVTDAQQFARQLRQRADVADVLIRTPEQGLSEFRELSGFGEALDALQTNPLPTVLVVTPRSSADTETAALVAQFTSNARVDLVQYDAAWRHKLTAILQLAERVVLVVAILLALATVLVTGNTVRMDIQSRAAEISLMQTIGASNRFVRRPFLYAGFWYGLLGSLLALLLVAAVEQSLARPVEHVLDLYTHRVALRGIGATAIAIVVAASALLGWLGAYAVTTRQLLAGRPR